MQDTSSFFPKLLYSQHLSSIRDIPFTRREIDVMACLLGARKTSKIAYLLSIDPRTVETYIRNITLKLECNTREGIIDFLELSDKVPYLRKHYSYLQIESIFEKSLKDISKFIRQESLSSLFISGEQEKLQFPLISLLKTHLKLAGVTIAKEGATEGEYLVYALPPDLQDISVPLAQLINKYPKDKVLFLLVHEQKKRELPKELQGYEIISIKKYQNYYFYIFGILKTIFPKVKVDYAFSVFQEKYEKIQNVMKSEYPLQISSHPQKEQHLFLEQVKSIISARKWHASIILLIVFFVSVGIFSSYWDSKNKSLKHPSALSDLSIPAKSVFLNRPELLSEIKKGFGTKDGIQTLALVGIGGAGKTTLAREYARQHKGNVIWEINAETHTSLIESFESLAHTLTTAPEDKRELRELTEIKAPSEREKKIIDFVKARLKLHSNWLLIYDNVEKLTDIQKYFPLNSETWGKGKVIMTTRDSTIQNNKQVNHVVSLGALDKTQKLNLFTQIMGNEENKQLTSTQQDETLSFLEKIPPFPLDISVAAYYLKTTKAPYANYLEHLTKFDKNFTTVQEDLLKGAGDYTKTRHGIIALSLEQIMNIHKDFPDLLLFISLLDSQHIPRHLLTTYKNETIVDNFIYHLKKYSLISDDRSSASIGSTFSMHRSTQDITFSYLAKILKLDKEAPLLEKIVYTLNDYLDQVIEREDFEKMQIMAQHLEKALHYSNLLTDFSKGLLESKLGVLYYYINDDKSRQFLESSLKKLTLEKTSAEKNLRIARSFLHIGSVYTELRFDEKAQELFENILNFYGEKGLKNYTTLSLALSHLGNLHRRLKNYDKAKTYLEESVSLNKQSSGDQKSLARTLAYLGTVYRGLGFYQKAINSLEESLALYNKNFSNDFFRIGWILTQLGNVNRELGNLEKAKRYLEDGLLVFQKHLPENHVDKGLVLAYLGNHCREQGKLEKSRDYLEQSLKIYQKYYDETHTRMGWILFHLASTYKAMGNDKEAQKLFDTVLKVYSHHCNKETVEAGRLLKEMAEISIGKSNLDEAENFIIRSLKILQDYNHVDAYHAFEVLGEIYLKKSNQSSGTESNSLKTQALDAWNQALIITEKNFPKSSVHPARIRCTIKKVQG